MTIIEAAAKLKALTADLPPPHLPRDQHGNPREGYDKPDGREVIKRWTHWQEKADRILKRRTA